MPFLGSKTAFLRSEIADFEAILAFKTPFFTNFLPYWPYMMMGHVGGPPWYLYKGPGSLNMSLMAIFLNPRWSKKSVILTKPHYEQIPSPYTYHCLTIGKACHIEFFDSDSRVLVGGSFRRI